MNESATGPHSSTTQASRLTRLRDGLRDRRRRRAEQRRLVAELGSYRTASERLELEAMLSRGSEREVEAIHHLLHASRRAA